MSSGQPYDPYIPGGQPPQKGNQKTQAIQAQIDDTVGIMRDNITKVAERGERLDTLQDKTDNLAVSAQGFRRGANRVRKQMWWKDMKMRLLIALGVIVLLLIIIIPIVDAEPLGPIRPPSASTNSSSTDGGVPNRFAPPT
ncbi:hypothetical protein Pst134EA_024279 [Puccinia striiformis f. sp. tritici]|uniref:V-SNARE coiled-coil homology domain-containing protein n=1 Tax=Puccinia striiformis TaxID=27350 RepID=A0A2S4W2D2_9BASI|nr:uncharacterized protein Pst134EA_032038 [Puccinia striiformis f. sp. tritici]XP_047800611.1 hypothetical protein Pst134EA_024279 [Puccinia striiformis f. sp. tritici]KAI9606734.1 hypothetical protein H4Q26_006271 [Puccinia striiformis f. sp. tritici PST-130]POW15943.1 hypothetical protein PSTT_01742 [Puccinia striiformis]KAH9444374.1 hypothetical protein Pst134EA_032038 [Puccinia striiformis f. sp. tritici]KAH9444712.1 hypothetical protein Pst134EB_024968 [Puccinia striiformis f. sp. tritic